MSWGNPAVYHPFALAFILAVLREADALFEHEEASKQQISLGLPL